MAPCPSRSNVQGALRRTSRRAQAVLGAWLAIASSGCFQLVFGDRYAKTTDASAADAIAADSIADGGADSLADGVAEGGEDVLPDAVDGCTNRWQDEDESDVDCGGGSTCARCQNGGHCSVDADCASSRCLAGLCAEVMDPCKDQRLGPGETDVDCGGTCAAVARCATGKHCLATSDCADGTCRDGLCVDPCVDGIRDGDESDIDCGGRRCPSCPTGGACVQGSDCKTNICVDRVCAVPGCSDRVRNQDESDVDCGGSCAARCPVSATCLAPSDCASYVCLGGKCVADDVVAAEDVIDPIEDEDSFIEQQLGRTGTWYHVNDGTGTHTLAYPLIPGGRGVLSTRAVKTSGSGFHLWGAGVGFDLNNELLSADTKQAYDASRYSRLTFWARSQVGTLKLTVLATDAQTEPALGQCQSTKMCDDHHSVQILLTPEWTRYFVSFSAMRRADSATRVQTSKLVGIQFRVSANQDFDYWLDDVAFSP